MTITEMVSIPTERADEISALFHKAEKAVKTVELLHGELTVPAVNQLRYVAYHLTKYFQNPDGTEDELDLAVKHCKRAAYDAYEAGILYNILEIKKFNDDYRKVVITKVVTDYATKRQTFKEAVLFLRDIDKETRYEHHAECEVRYDEINSVVEYLNNSRSELNKLMVQERKKFIFTVLGGIAALIVICTFLSNLKLPTASSTQATQQSKPALPAASQANPNILPGGPASIQP